MARLLALGTVAAAGLLVLGACSTAPADDPPTEGDRAATVEELRRTVGPPAVEVGSAAATLAERLEELHAELPTEPSQRRAAVDAIRSEELTDLDAALEGYGSDLAGELAGPDADAARAALADSRDAAAALREHADADLQLVVAAADADAELTQLVAAWDEPGSRQEQLERLQETAAAAAALADDLATLDDVPDCSGSIRLREEAARAVAEATIELRDLVAARRGSEFDERRRALLSDPYGAGRPLVDADREDIGCWRRDGPVPAATAALRAALERLEDALNPSDLAMPAGG